MSDPNVDHFLANWVEMSHKAASQKVAADPTDNPPDSEEDDAELTPTNCRPR